MTKGVRLLGIGTVAVAAAGIALAGASSATAVPAGTIGAFPTWSSSGAFPTFTAAGDFASPTSADVTLTTDSTSVGVASGSSAFLGPATDFGADLGSTRAQPYLTLGARSATPAPTPPSTTTPPPSTTTFTFSSAPAAGWAFALGDIDADWAFLTPLAADGSALPVADLGFQSVDNYCDATPKPAGCPSGPSTDVPHWVPGPGADTVAYGGTSIIWAPGTVYGNVLDTGGASAWFKPAVGVRGVRISYGALSGTPSYQLWIAQPAPIATITGTVTPGGGGTIQAGTTVQLDAADGTPVADLNGDPVTAPVSTTDGSFSFTTEQRTTYELEVVPPAGYTAPAPVTVPAEATNVTAPALELDPSTPPGGGSASPTLAPTGVDLLPALAAAVLMLLAGAGLLRVRRRH